MCLPARLRFVWAAKQRVTAVPLNKPVLSLQIGQSLAQFGVQEGGGCLVAARFDASEEELRQLVGAIAGQQVAVAELPAVADAAALRKVHKVTEGELQVGSLTEAVLCRIAARDCS